MTHPTFNPAAEAPVLVIGAAGVDIVGRLEGKLQSGTSNPAKIRFSFGGVARNVAENLARLGQPVRLITAVGSGRYGEQLLSQLVTAGVDVDAVLRTTDFSTGSYLAILGAAGELYYALDDMNATNALTSAYLRENIDLFKDASLLYLDANLPKTTIRTAMSLARRTHLKVFADPTSIALAPRFKPYLDRLYLITPNHAEAAIYCEKSFDPGDHQQSLDAAKQLVSQGVSVAIITLGEFGVCYATSETSGYIPAIHTDIVDPTGAGDALSATVIFALLNQIPLDDAIRLGVSAASLTLRFPGAVIPDLSLEMLYDQLVI